MTNLLSLSLCGDTRKHTPKQHTRQRGVSRRPVESIQQGFIRETCQWASRNNTEWTYVPLSCVWVVRFLSIVLLVFRILWQWREGTWVSLDSIRRHSTWTPETTTIHPIQKYLFLSLS